MRPGYRIPAPLPHLALAAVGLAALTLGAAGWRQAPVPSPAICASVSAMSDAEMVSLSAEHYLAAPAHGTAINLAVAATFFASNYQFNADNNVFTQVDVVHITEGQSVMFKWVIGVHTTTSGFPTDLDAGSIWDSPLDALHPEVVVPFPTAGTYPFHCYLHGGIFNMVGQVIVAPAATPTVHSTWGRIKSQYR